MNTRRSADPDNWKLTRWLKLAALGLGVGAALIGAMAWAQTKILEPEVEARRAADRAIESRVVSVADSVRHIYESVDSKLDRVLNRLERH